MLCAISVTLMAQIVIKECGVHLHTYTHQLLQIQIGIEIDLHQKLHSLAKSESCPGVYAPYAVEAPDEAPDKRIAYLMP